MCLEKNPFKFSAENPRVVNEASRPNTVVYGAAAIFLFSLHLYNRRFFRKDGNALNFLGFAAASVPASWAYSNFIFSSAEIEAAIINNEREAKH